jgi:Xaa-Pro aminopeptidase
MKKIITWILLIAFVLSGLVVVIFSAPSTDPGRGVIKRAPEAPKFTDQERQSELARRRAEVARRMPPNSMMVLWSAEPRNYAGDVDFYYRQENNLFYLTHLKQNNATLVIQKTGGNVSEMLFIPARDPQFETWNGRMYSNEDAARISGVRTIVNASELPKLLAALEGKQPFASRSGAKASVPQNVYMLLPYGPDDSSGNAEFNREAAYAQKLRPGYKVEQARNIFAEMRHVKSPFELKLLQHAIDITIEAQMRAMAMVGRAKWEYEVQAEVEYTFRRRNADYWGYPSIVGCGPNATTLHYVESQSPINEGDVLLMDVGAEYEHYTADVTRSFPVSGKFTKEQAEIYRIVYDAQDAVAAVTRPGATKADIEKASAKAVQEGLIKLGLITAMDATYDATWQGKTIKMQQYKLWFMHGNSHWLGMNVHDVGDYGAPLKPGMVFTNEPGLYFRLDALDYLPDTSANRAFLEKVRPVYDRYRGIGIRIEDDMLVTEKGVEWMTAALPRKLEDVEAFMAQASKEMAYTASVSTPRSNIFISGTGQRSAFPFAAAPTAGVTLRRGTIESGLAAAYSALHHHHAD